MLGFNQPTFVSQPTTPPPGVPIQPEQSGTFFNMAVTFDSRDVAVEPRLADTVVRVEHVYGKKKAREMCCRELLPLLTRIKGSRLERASKGRPYNITIDEHNDDQERQILYKGRVAYIQVLVFSTYD